VTVVDAVPIMLAVLAFVVLVLLIEGIDRI
jgi:hypothetical protein